MQDLRVIHEEVQVHPMVSWAAGPGPLGASSVLEPRVDLVLEEMVEEESAAPVVERDPADHPAAELSEIFADIRERKAGKRRQGKEEA